MHIVAFAAIGCSPTTEYNKVIKRSAFGRIFPIWDNSALL
jgi:hypothetical protein